LNYRNGTVFLNALGSFFFLLLLFLGSFLGFTFANATTHLAISFGDLKLGKTIVGVYIYITLYIKCKSKAKVKDKWALAFLREEEHLN